MKEPKEYLREFLENMKDMDRAKLAQEFKEIVYHTNKQLFGQIPGVSAVVGILVGSWIASTFTNSPLKGFLSSWGIMKGGTHVVSTTTYRFLSVALSIVVTAFYSLYRPKGPQDVPQKAVGREQGVRGEIGKKGPS